MVSYFCGNLYSHASRGFCADLFGVLVRASIYERIGETILFACQHDFAGVLFLKGGK